MTGLEPRFFTTSILPVRERLVLKGGRNVRVPLRVRVGYFHHPSLGHTLIDTGFGPALTEGRGHSLPLRAYRQLIRPTILSADPLGGGLARLGLAKGDIRTVILTHFHADHISGLAELPGAQVICPAAAWRAVADQNPLRNALSGTFPELLPTDLASRLALVEDFPLVEAPLALGPARDLVGDRSVLAVDLPGHLQGHIGLCFDQAPRPFLYATDAQWLLDAILQDRCPGVPARLVYHDRTEAMETVRRLRDFAAAGGELALCHDPNPHRLDLDPEVGG